MIWATQGSLPAKMMTKRQQKSLFSTMKLYSDIQSSTFPPEFHDEPRPLVQIANGLGRSSQQKQTTQDFFILAVKLDSALMCLCDKKLSFLSWAIRPVFAEPVKNNKIKTHGSVLRGPRKWGTRKWSEYILEYIDRNNKVTIFTHLSLRDTLSKIMVSNLLGS